MPYSKVNLDNRIKYHKLVGTHFSTYGLTPSSMWRDFPVQIGEHPHQINMDITYWKKNSMHKSFS